jgi:hypothetical protein
MSESRKELLVEVDDRRRVALGKIGRPQDTRYLVTAHADGTIVLRPAIVMTEAQLRYVGSPDVVGQVEEGMRRYEGEPQPFVRNSIPARRGEEPQ